MPGSPPGLAPALGGVGHLGLPMQFPLPPLPLPLLEFGPALLGISALGMRAGPLWHDALLEREF
jgi:hypothetical protein